jgi:predicted N-acetyltransferase YhbS
VSQPASAPASGEVTLREVRPEDAEACAQIVFDAFGDIHDHHRFPRDFPELAAATQLMAIWVPHPRVWGVVAERDGRIVGSNFLDERDPIRGVGPITIAPEGQNAGVGRRLMEAVLDRAREAPGVRLMQDAFHMRSLSLYERLGFDVKEPVGVVSGRPRSGPVGDVEVRRMEEGDVEECGALCERVHGFPRTGELRDAVHAFAPHVAVRDGRIVAYSSTVLFWPMNHGVAETVQDMQALLLGAAAALDEPLALPVPLRSGLFRWALDEGLHLVKPMNLMALGEYQEPQGAWYPSVLY